MKIQKINSPGGLHRDLYHNLLKISWGRLFLVYISIYLSINCLFATLYLMVPGSITSSANDFRSAFFFSVQTFSTVGYGIISPQSLYGNVIVVLEIMTGVMSMALTTGLVFAKFSRPSAKILYSKNLLLTKFDGEKVLMFRMANARTNQITSANVELHHVYPVITAEGAKIVRFTPLKLQKNYSPVFALSWSVFHTIDADSPFFGKTSDDLKKLEHNFYVIFHGIDGTFSQTIHDMQLYKMSDLLINHHFADILQTLEDGTRVIDYKRFHETVPEV
jgi:inward rectifier potassium channel